MDKIPLLELTKIESVLLDLFRDAIAGELEIDNSDLQGIVSAQVLNAYNVGKNESKTKIDRLNEIILDYEEEYE